MADEDTQDIPTPTKRLISFDTAAVTYQAEANFWKNRALIAQEDFLRLADKHAELLEAYNTLKKNTSPTKPPASPLAQSETEA